MCPKQWACFSLSVLGSRVSVDIDRAYSAPPDLQDPLQVRLKNQATTRAAPKGDAFESFLRSVFKAIEAGVTATRGNDLIVDARAMQLLSRASEAETSHVN